MEKELKHCPFCGGAAAYVIGSYENRDTTLTHTIRCKDIFGCGANITNSISPYSRDYEEQIKKFCDKWNTRFKGD